MRRIYIEPARLEAAAIELTDDDAHYLVAVLRMADGAELMAFDGQGRERPVELMLAKHAAAGDKRPVLRPTAPVTTATAPVRQLWLLQGLPKGDRSDLIVQKATELGVARISWVAAQRSIARDTGRGQQRMERWQRIAQEAARQSGSTTIPQIDPPRPLGEVLPTPPRDGELDVLDAGYVGLMLWEEERNSRMRELLPRLTMQLARRRSQLVAIAVGPEGGWAPAEVELATSRGLLSAGLGSRILRTETAAIATLAVVAYELGLFG